jgi:pilus assembly protein CpaF
MPDRLPRLRMRDDHELSLFELAPAAEISVPQLGEIRGGEAFDLLQLLNTGHSGTLSTIHASSAKQGLARFTSCVLQSGIELPYRAIKTNIGDSLNVVIHVERRPGRRFISEVLEINSYDPDADLFDYSAIYQRPEAQP